MGRRRGPIGTLVLLALLVPATAAGKGGPRCVARDEFVPIHHGDGGGVWIPREVACGGKAPLIVMLHGANGDHVSHVSVGGGRELGKVARRLIAQRRARPVLLAEPVHFATCGSGLYGDSYDFPGYRVKLEALLAVRRIHVTSYTVMGHSGAGCCGGVHRAAEAFGKVRVLGLVDVCYGSPSYAAAVRDRYDDDTTVVSISRGAGVFSGYGRFEQRILGRDPEEVSCDHDLYRQCLRSEEGNTYAFTTTRRDRKYHAEIPTDALQTVLTRFFRPRPRPKLAPPAKAPQPATVIARPEHEREPRAAGAAH